MIEGAFLHLPGIGPATAQRLRAAGFLTWSDVLAHPERLPLGPAGKEKLLAAVERNRQALEAFVDGGTTGTWPDYQIAAFLMAVVRPSRPTTCTTSSPPSTPRNTGGCWGAVTSD